MCIVTITSLFPNIHAKCLLFLIFFKVLSIGYVISGFLIKFQDDLLQSNVVPTLNLCNIGIFPLGSFINAVIFAPTPALIVNVLNSAITYIGIYKRKNRYLQIVSIIYKEYFIKYPSFFLSLSFYLILVFSLWSVFIKSKKKKYIFLEKNFVYLIFMCNMPTLIINCLYFLW